ncbi:MAG TPA: PspC domain-containing protein, partial [Puia sp.]|nr:PspC domain-containing protein [Puia sp.]
RKRLYRNPDNRVIAGVASGLAAYFHMEVWIPRLIFALPLIAGVIASIFRHAWGGWDPGPIFITGGFGGTLFVTYVILWIVLPEANTASEKLEMRGEKVDLESIKNTIKSDLEGFKGRAGQMGTEIKDKAQTFSKEVADAAQRFGKEAGPAATRTGSGIGHAIGVLFKAFFLLIAGIICFALIMVLIGLVFSGAGVFPFRNYMLTGFWQNFLAWSSLILFICVPIVGLLTWLIRRIMGVRSKNNYLGYALGSLWTIGLICFIIFISMVVSNFKTKASMEDEPTLVQPSTSKMFIRMEPEKTGYYGSDWYGFNWDEGRAPFYSLSADSVMMNTVRLKLAKSKDSEYHLHRVKFSHGNDPAIARNLASQIQFNPRQNDSVLYLPQGFAITPNQKFRNQQVLIVMEVPVGKKIEVDGSVEDYKWFDITINHRHRGYTFEWSDDWNDKYPYESNIEYVMTENGLERTGKKDDQNEEDQNGRKNQKSDKGYRYKGPADSARPKTTSDTTKVKRTAELVTPSNKMAEFTVTEMIPQSEKS